MSCGAGGEGLVNVHGRVSSRYRGSGARSCPSRRRWSSRQMLSSPSTSCSSTNLSETGLGSRLRVYNCCCVNSSEGKMHDFCFTYPYGFLVLLGGVIGFLRKGSSDSLLGGVGSGAALLLAGYISHQAYLRGAKSWFALLLETGVTLALTWVMGQRFMATSKFMPAGLVAALSGVMALFYLYKVVTGGNHIVKKET